MTVREFRIIDNIQRECIESWGLVQDLESAADYFGISRDMPLPGQWAYASRHLRHDFSFIKDEDATHILPYTEHDVLYLFKLD